MQEFSSVTASSYDADSLTPLLNEKAAEGWDVVSIVSAGTNIVAYLSRQSGELDSNEAAFEFADEEAVGEEAAAAVAVEETLVGESAFDVNDEEAASDVAEADVAEPAGWAAAPDETPAPADDSIAGLVAQVDETEAAPVLAAAAVPAPAPAPEPAPAAEPAVPAGWYADPSGRYELRYWDGAAWTEHVSRAGQQFTDPPVA